MTEIFNSLSEISKGAAMNLENIFDTHCHYDDPAFSPDPFPLLSSLFSQGLSGAVHASVDPDSATFGIMMSKKYPKYYTSVGIHPEYADKFDAEDVEKLGEMAKSSDKVVAIGEIGLDYHYDGYDREKQISLFKEQVILANDLGLPVIVHCRDAIGDCMEILKKLKPKGVMHCFSGSWETAKEVLSLGMYLGFTGVLTFKNSKKAREVVEKMPADRILFETDCPYMAPEPNRGKRCDSGMIPYIVEKAAEIRGTTYHEMAKTAFDNALRMYGIAENY